MSPGRRIPLIFCVVHKVPRPDCNVIFAAQSAFMMLSGHVVCSRVAPWTMAKLSLAQRNVFEELAARKRENRRIGEFCSLPL
jgi:hypothetical protein